MLGAERGIFGVDQREALFIRASGSFAADGPSTNATWFACVLGLGLLHD